jgi:uncharacterized RDD family membrane protein YckC
MANATHQFFGSLHGLPDPERDRQFYEGVPSRRLVAWIVDVLAVIAMSIVVIPVVGLLTLGLAFFVAPLIFMALSFVYRTATLASRSATWGMRLMGIELRRADGTRFDLAYAAAHTALYTACIAMTPLQVGSIVTVLATRYQQTLPDLVLRTTAINSPED